MCCKAWIPGLNGIGYHRDILYQHRADSFHLLPAGSTELSRRNNLHLKQDSGQDSISVHDVSADGARNLHSRKRDNNGPDSLISTFCS